MAAIGRAGGAPLRIGLVGCGAIAELRHLPALGAVSGGEVVAVADADPAAAERVGTALGVESRHRDVESLLEGAEVDCVGVTVPAQHHAEVAIPALEAGKHVLVEKPLAVASDDCDRMVAAAERSGTVAMVAHNLRFHRLVQRARELIVAGAIGEPEGIRTLTVGGSHEERAGGGPVPAWKTNSAMGGGAIMEKGVHHYDLWAHLTGANAVELGAVAEIVGEREIRAAVSARLDNGTIATATCAYGRPPAAEVTVFGAAGRLDLDLYAFDGLRVLGPHAMVGGVRQRAANALAALRAFPRGVGDLGSGGAYVRSYAREWEHFLAGARGEAAVGCSFEDGRRAARIAGLAQRSAREGRRMDVAAGVPVADAAVSP
jgi:predicted dehydrogenase